MDRPVDNKLVQQLKKERRYESAVIAIADKIGKEQFRAFALDLDNDPISFGEAVAKLAMKLFPGDFAQAPGKPEVSKS